MKERADDVDGAFSLRSSPGQGTVIQVVLATPAGSSSEGERRGILSFRRRMSRS